MDERIARKWFKQAVHDLEMAERSISIEGYDVAAFLAHQAVEKLLKSLLILEGKEAPRIHKLERLSQLLNLPEKLEEIIYDLTEDYASSRYPDVTNEMPYLQYDKESAHQKVAVAKVIFKDLKPKYAVLED